MRKQNNYYSCDSIKLQKRIFLVILLLSSFDLCAAERRPAILSFNFYPYLTDVKTDSEFTLNTFVPLPGRLSYFSFLNFGSVFSSGPVNFLITEQNLRWRISEEYPFELVVQDTIRYGADNDTVHLGVRWRLNDTEFLKSFLDAVHLNYSVHFFPIRFDQRDPGGWQMSHSYEVRFPYISDRLYFSGFLDHNIDEESQPGVRKSTIISESQLGFRLFRKVYAVAEFRRNEYRISAKNNIGIGIEIKSSW